MKKKKLLKQRQKQLKKRLFTPGKTFSFQLFNSGRLLEAESESANELKKDPRNAEALFVQGHIAKHHDQLLKAADYMQRAISSQPYFGEAYFALGSIQHDLGTFEEAIHSYQKILSWGIKTPDIYNNLGNALKDFGELDKAISSYQKALQLDQKHYLAHFNLGIAYHIRGQLQDSIECFQKVLAINKDYYLALDNLGTIFDDLGKFDEAITCYKSSLRIFKNNPISYNNLANALKNKGLLQEAEANCQKALEIDKNFAPAYKNLGTIYHDQGKVQEALDCYRKSISCKPDHKTHSNLLFTLNYLPGISQKEIYAESVRWQEMYASNLLKENQTYDNSRVKERRLRVGYVSPDFCDHSVSYFIEPVLHSHNRDNVEVYCYANVKKPDAVTKRLQEKTHIWHDIYNINDLEVAELVRKDRIDILVDLAGHTAANRLLVFAQKPAPVQVTWLGHPNTTGLQTMDFRLTDAIADPPGEADRLCSEELLRLEHGFLCYQHDESAPEVSPPAWKEHGHVTFGSFNNLTKVNPEVIRLWAEILLEVPGSRLLLKSKALGDNETTARYVQMFEAEGVSAKRIELCGMLPKKEDHLGLYRKIDIGLDPFPYNGTTTTCEALWMGVPVVTLLGERHSGRVGASIMHQVGLAELVAESPERYKDLAVLMANNVDRLADLRGRLRKQMQQSQLMNMWQFTKLLENAYQKIWSQWCEEPAKHQL